MIRIVVKCTEINRSNKSDRSDTMQLGGFLCPGMKMILRARPRITWSDSRQRSKLAQIRPAARRRNAFEMRSWSRCVYHAPAFYLNFKMRQTLLIAECWRAHYTRSMKRCVGNY